MTSQTNSKVRRIICPKCWMVLPELAELPLYRCGGCNAILQGKMREKDPKDTESQVHKADPKHKNDLENTFVNPITDESCIGIIPKRVDSITEDGMEWLGGINQSNQSSSSHATSCQEIESSSQEASAGGEEEEGKFPLDQYGTENHNKYWNDDKESEKSVSIEILSSSELNHHERNSLAPQSYDYECESFLSSVQKEAQVQHSSSEYNCDGEKGVSETDLENATEDPSAGKETESQRSSEDTCDGGKKESVNELQNTSENPSTGNSDLVKVFDRGKSSADGGREWIGSVNQSNQIPFSHGISCREIPQSSLESVAYTEVDKCEIPFDQYGTEAHNISGNNDMVQSGDVSISNKVLSSPKLNHLENDSSVPGNRMYESDESLLSSHKQVTGSGYSSPNNNDGGENEDPSQVDGVEREVDKNRESLSILISPNAETFLDTVTKDQISSSSHSFSREGILVDNIMSPHRESMKQLENGMVPGFQRVSSDDTLENMPHFYAKGNLGVELGSSTDRNYYAHDGSASCNDADDEVPHRRFHLLKKSLKDVGPNSTKVLPGRGEFIMNDVTTNESDLQRQPMNSRAFLQGKKHSTTKVSRWHQDELLEHTRYRYPVRNTMMNEKDDYQSRLLFSKHSSQADHGNSSSSNYWQNDSSALPDNPHELHRLELLRMVYDLQDQLKRAQMSKGMPHGRFSTGLAEGKEHHFAANRKNYTDLAYHKYHGKYSRDITWFKTNKHLGMALHEDPTHYMHRVDCSCTRCFSQEQHHAAQLPPRVTYDSAEQSMANARQTWRPHHSASSSSQHYTNSEFSLWSHDMKSDDHWYDKHEEERIRRIAKRHFKPIAGGAPIVACYHCSEMLQLPADSLLFKRRCHRLRCGSCSEVLKFSLENKIHVVQYDPIHKTPASEIDENTRSSDRPLTEQASRSDNSQSFSRSCSTGDNFSVTPPVEKVPAHRKMSSASSFGTQKEGNEYESTRESVNKYKNSVESFKDAGSSTKVPETESSCSEIEVESQLSDSALHKLMGYSSTRRLVYQ